MTSYNESEELANEFDYDPLSPTNRNLPRVAAPLPISHPCWIVTFVECCERISYYGLSGVLMNYMAGSPTDRIPGRLGLGPLRAAQLSYFFQFWCYVCPLFGAWCSDTLWGKYRTILVFCGVYIIGIFVLVTSLLAPEGATVFWSFLIGIVLIGLGTGGVKANVGPLVAECLEPFSPFVRKVGTKSVVIDYERTMLRVFMIFYLSINIGLLLAILTTTLEAKSGYFAAFIVPLVCFWLGWMLFVYHKDRYVHKPPLKGAISNSFKIAFKALRTGFESCKGSMAHLDSFVDDVHRAVKACRIFGFFAIYWAVYGQILNNFITQAGQMELHGIPNDIMQNIDPLTIVLSIPICDRWVYPFIRQRLGIKFGPTVRITCGFVFGALAMFYAAFVQNLIYNAGPCYSNPLCTPEQQPNHVHVAIQAPAYFLIAVSEILASVTGLELAYLQAPESMRSFVMSVFLLTSAAGSVLGMLISPFAQNPHMVSFYAVLGIICLIGGGLFYLTCKGLAEQNKEKAEVEEFLLRPVRASEEGIE